MFDTLLRPSNDRPLPLTPERQRAQQVVFRHFAVLVGRGVAAHVAGRHGGTVSLGAVGFRQRDRELVTTVA